VPALAATAIVAAGVAMDVPVTDMRPRSERDFWGPLADAVHDGFLDFYDTGLPFDRLEFREMHGLVLLAVFGFAALVALLMALGRPLAGVAALLVAVGWPTTLAPGGRPLLLGAVGLAGVLAVLFLVRQGARGLRGLVPAAAAAVVLVAAATALATQDAVAKQAFVAWQRWDLYDAPKDPVGVRYIWNSHYQGITFPEEETVVLRVKVTGAKDRKLYWRATTLDEYTGVGWRESLDLDAARRTQQIDVAEFDDLLPPDAADEDEWVRQDVTVEALADDHLIASAQPVRWKPGTGEPVQTASGGVVLLPRGLRPGQRYTAWSYVPKPTVKELTAAPSAYAAELDRYLELVPGVPFPDWGERDRQARVERLFDAGSQNFLVISHEAIDRLAREVVGDARSPYAAALALETWFRKQGGFRYEEQPRQISGPEPPLVTFLLRTHEGYCQQYAGAMAVMLRLLGVPARVAAGFTSGKFDKGSGEWVVTDHNAHTWVEAYFPGFGWLPFDPTPGRGELTAEYSAVSGAFDFSQIQGGVQAQRLLGTGVVLDVITAEALRARRGAEGTALAGGDTPGGVGGSAPAAGDGSRNIVLVALAVIGVLVGGLVVAKELRRAARFAARDPRDLAAACRRDLVAFLADQRIGTPPGATLHDLGRIVEREFVVDAGPFVRTLSLARFGHPDDREVALRRARRELRRLLREIRRELGPVDRLRGLFRIRSLAV
jgi:transglutaminase-like putative cysteine protease